MFVHDMVGCLCTIGLDVCARYGWVFVHDRVGCLCTIWLNVCAR